MVVRVVLILLGIAVSLSPTSAQVSPYEPARGFVEGIRASRSTVFSRCVTELEVDHVGKVVDLGCSVMDVVGLGSGAEPVAWMLRYRRGVALSFDQFVDTLGIDELVLARESPSEETVEALWHLTRVRAYEVFDRIESVESDRGVLVSYLTCLVGTGGCAQQFLFGRDNWEVVDQPYIDALRELLPQGCSLHKGRLIDLSTLTGVQPFARPGDANCCPSGMIRFTVELREGALHLVTATVSGDT